MDPTNGLGTLNLAGGIRFKAGKKKATVKGLVLNTGKSSLIAQGLRQEGEVRHSQGPELHP